MYSYYAFYFFLALADASSGKKTLGKINDKLKFGIIFVIKSAVTSCQCFALILTHAT